MSNAQHDKLNRLLGQAGVSKIVYALVMPETEWVVDQVLDGTEGDRGLGRQALHSLFREAWTQKQDLVHEAFFATWLQWVSPILQWRTPFAYQYPTGGASEALREAIHAYAARARGTGFAPCIHVFEGEYEGYAAYAAAAGIEFRTHNRLRWHEAIDQVAEHHQFYLSQPSAIDGMVWPDYDAFLDQLALRSPLSQLMLDVTYVGSVARPFQIQVDHPLIAAVFFSLSKPAGMYYYRIGGVLSRFEYPGLFGNKWFKNLLSLRIGTQFMQRFDVHELPCKYRPFQNRVIEQVNAQLSLCLQPADVLLLAVSPPAEFPSDLERFLLRGSVGEQRVRVCLTARLAHAIDPSLSPSVAARYYEQLAD